MSGMERTPSGFRRAKTFCPEILTAKWNAQKSRKIWFLFFDRALADTPQNAGLALGLGTIYLKQAAHREGDTEYIYASCHLAQ